MARKSYMACQADENGEYVGISPRSSIFHLMAQRFDCISGSSPYREVISFFPQSISAWFNNP